MTIDNWVIYHRFFRTMCVFIIAEHAALFFPGVDMRGDMKGDTHVEDHEALGRFRRAAS